MQLLNILTYVRLVLWKLSPLHTKKFQIYDTGFQCIQIAFVK